MEQIILFVKITNQYFERKCFSVGQFRSWWRFRENQAKGAKNFVQYLPVVHSKHTASYTG